MRHSGRWWGRPLCVAAHPNACRDDLGFGPAAAPGIMDRKPIMPAPLTDQQVAAYAADGLLLVRRLFAPDEAALLRDAARQDRTLNAHAFSRDDGYGRRIRLTLWNRAGDDIFGLATRSRRLVDAVEQLIGAPVYHYHSKVVMKQPHDGGAWAWHQDFGYWHQNAILYPRLASTLIALHPANRANGCREVIRGPHHCGRLNHQLSCEQATADPSYVEHLLTREPIIYGEMEPGDVLFMHCNTLHRSGPNTTDQPRWLMISCYNATDNRPFKRAPHGGYEPLVKVDDDALRTAGARLMTDDADWLTQPNTQGLDDALKRDAPAKRHRRWWRW